MKFDFITIGGATRDISFFTDQGVLIDNKADILRQELLAFEYGAKIKVDKFYYLFGGGAANAAVCLSRLSLKTACLSNVGGDEHGHFIIKNLRDQRVNTSLVRVDKKAESASSFVLVAPGGERIIFGSRGANQSFRILPSDVLSFKKASNLYLASLAGDWFANLKIIFSAVSPAGPSVYWNPGGTQIRGGLSKLTPFLKKTTVLAINEDEALELVLSSPKYKNINHQILNDIDFLLKTIYQFGPKIVMITRGAKGVAVYDGKKIYNKPATKEKKRLDTTGIGDVFNSTFAAGYSQYQNINKALNLALKNAASKISHLGAQNGLLKKNIKQK